MRDGFRSARARAFLDVKAGLALLGALLVACALARGLARPRPAAPLEAQRAQLRHLIDQLQQSGLGLRVVAAGSRPDSVYLTEDPEATWEAMQAKARQPERIHQWQGTVWAGCLLAEEAVEDLLADWGEHGCRLGDVLLFGDARLLRRIQALRHR
jgi:hypothetical protein